MFKGQPFKDLGSDSFNRTRDMTMRWSSYASLRKSSNFVPSLAIMQSARVVNKAQLTTLIVGLCVSKLKRLAMCVDVRLPGCSVHFDAAPKVSQHNLRMTQFKHMINAQPSYVTWEAQNSLRINLLHVYEFIYQRASMTHLKLWPLMWAFLLKSSFEPMV